MKKKEVLSLHHGLYKVYWKSGGFSLAAVGSLSDGNRWLAPCNWVGFATNWRSVWRDVERVELLYKKREE